MHAHDSSDSDAGAPALGSVKGPGSFAVAADAAEAGLGGQANGNGTSGHRYAPAVPLHRRTLYMLSAPDPAARAVIGFDGER